MATKRERKTNDNTRDTSIRTYEGQHNEGPLGGSPRHTFNGRSAREHQRLKTTTN